jgi:TatD DNase family protein
MKMLIDTHAHLDFPEFAGDLAAVLERAKKAGVYEVVTIGINLASSEKAAELAGLHPEVYATVGIHPHDAFALSGPQLTALETLARKRRVVAIGEVGLDYYRDRQPRAIQRQCLRQQLEIACKTRLPVVFHIREAHPDFFAIVTDYAPALNGVVLHCFSGDWAVARRCLDMGFYLSIPGTVTFPKAEKQQKVARLAPLDRLLVETDAPYLAPVPHRGKVNEPAFTRYTAEKIAALRGCSLEEVAHQTTANAHQVFRIENRTE